MRGNESVLVRWLFALTIVGSLAAGCAGAPEAAEELGRAASPIVDGTASDDSQNAVVRLLILDPSNSKSAEVCTGTLLAPDIVLTARHCVSRTQESVTCLEVDGKLVGGAIFEDHQASNLIVLLGTKPDPNATDAKGARIFHDTATNLCGHDLALVVLDRRLAAAVAPIAPIRLDTPPARNARFTAVGWGTNGAAFPTVRQQRADVTVEELGPIVVDLVTGHRVAIGSSELLAGEAGCAGDSGSPALDPTTGAVIGVAARSGVGASDPASPCRNSKNVYTVPSGFHDVIRAAFDAAGEQPWVEGNAEPPRAAPTSPAPTSTSKGCSVGPVEHRGALPPWTLAVLAGVLACALLRRAWRGACSRDLPCTPSTSVTTPSPPSSATVARSSFVR